MYRNIYVMGEVLQANTLNRTVATLQPYHRE